MCAMRISPAIRWPAALRPIAGDSRIAPTPMGARCAVALLYTFKLTLVLLFTFYLLPFAFRLAALDKPPTYGDHAAAAQTHLV